MALGMTYPLDACGPVDEAEDRYFVLLLELDFVSLTGKSGQNPDYVFVYC